MTIHARNARRSPKGAPQPASPIAEQFALQIRLEKLPRLLREFRFHPTRKWRLDFAWPDMLLAVEIDGEVHRIKDRFHADLEKHAQLLLRGWSLLRVGGREVRSGVGLNWLQAVLWERSPLGLSRAFTSGETREPATREPAPESGIENRSQLPTVPHRGTDLWISPVNDAPGGLEPSLGQRKWAITP